MKTSPSLRWRSTLGACGLLLGLLLPMGVRAGGPELTEAISAYENFEYQQALEMLHALARSPGLSPDQRAKVHMYTGLTHYTLGDRARAEQEFIAALKADYDIAPPGDTSPKIVEAFEAAKKTVAPPTRDDKPPVEDKDPKPNPDPPPGITGPAPSKGRTWTWVALGVGAAALAGGGVSAGLAAQAKGQFDDQEWADKAAGLKDKVETRALSANVLFGLGGAAIATAVILFFVEDTGPDAPESSASWRIDPGPLGVSATIEF